MSKLTKNKKGGAFAFVLIILLIICAVIIMPALVSGEGVDSIFDGFADWYRDFMGFFNQGYVDGFIGIGFTVHYTDGTSEDFGASPTFSVSSLSISVLGKDVNSIDVIVRGKFTADNVGVWSTHISQQIELYKTPELSPKYSSTGYFEESGNGWVADEVKTLSSVALSATVIDNLVAIHGVGEWFMQVNVSADVEAEIDGVNQTFEGLAPNGGLTFKYTSIESPDSFSVKTTVAPIS